MIIENVAASFPSRKVSNEEIVDIVRFHSKSFDGDLSKMLRVVQILLDRSGLVTRHWLAGGEHPIDHVHRAVQSALETTALRPSELDLLIYVGVGGGFGKLGNAYMVAKTLGIHNAECFDILDACMSWTRAVALANSLFKTRNLRNAMIVNAEFNMTAGGPLFPDNFSLENSTQLGYALPSYTIGEVATATLLFPDDPENFRMVFHSKPDLAELCTIPRKGFEGFCRPTDGVGKLGVGRFTAMGGELHQNLEQELSTLLTNAGLSGEDADIVFTHSSSSTEWKKAGEKHGFAEKIYHLYPHTGNIVSASIPAALALAKHDGRLKTGHRVMLLMGSAGMSFSACTFNH